MLSRRASETESTQVQERYNGDGDGNAPPAYGENSMASLPDPGEWNDQQQAYSYDGDDHGEQCNYEHNDDGRADGGEYYDEYQDGGEYRYEDDEEYQQEQQEQQQQQEQQHYEEHGEYDDAPYEEEDMEAPPPPVPQQPQQRGVRFRSVLKKEKSASQKSKAGGRKQISAYNLFGLSRVSAAYDTGQKGYLTDAEKKLREMDKANVGSLNNAQVAQLMEQKLRHDEIIARQRRLLYVLGVMTVLLMVSNLGTAWAAALLAKDTAVDLASGELRILHADGNADEDGSGSGSAVVVTRAMGDSFVFRNMNVSSVVLMNHHLESEEEEEDDEEENSMVPGGTAGAVGGGGDAAVANAEGGAATDTNDLLVPGAEGGQEEEEEEDDDDSLFCISPKQAAKLWHETSTGTAVTAFFDYSPPAVPTAADAATGTAMPPPEVHSLSLNADGALMNATHACLHTGLPSDAAGPQYVCIDFANTKCDAEFSRQQQDASASGGAAALSGANDGTSSADQRTAAASGSQNVFQGQDDGAHGGEDDDDHVHGRRMLFETALQELRNPKSADSLRPPNAGNLRGAVGEGASSASAQTRRTRRKKKKANANQNANRKNNRRKNGKKKIFDLEIPADMCIMIPMATGAAMHRPAPGFPSGPQQVAPATPADIMGDFISPYTGQEGGSF